MAAEPTTISGEIKLFEEVSDLLEWAHNRAAPLAFAGLSIATLLWVDFLKFYAIPVSFFSSSLLAALPALFATVGFAVMLLTVYAITPAFVLWTPLYPEGPTLAASYQSRNVTSELGTNEHNENELPLQTQVTKKKADLFIRWVVFSASVGLLWTMWVLSLFFLPKWTSGWMLPVMFLLSGMAGFAFLWRVFHGVSDRWPSWSFLFQFGKAIALQTIVAFMILYVILRTTTVAQITWLTAITVLVPRAGIYLCSLVVIGVAQLYVARRVTRGAYKGMLKHAMLVAIGMMAVVAAVPPVGGMLASYPLRATAFDNEPCIVLTLLPVPSAEPGSYATVQDLKNPGHSIPLEFVTHFEDMYYVKPEVSKGAIYPVPSSQVGALNGAVCKKTSGDFVSPPYQKKLSVPPKS